MCATQGAMQVKEGHISEPLPPKKGRGDDPLRFSASSRSLGASEITVLVNKTVLKKVLVKECSTQNGFYHGGKLFRYDSG